MTKIPDIFKEEFDSLNDAQKIKFMQLLSWSGSSALQGIPVPLITYEHIFKMVKQMGEDPIEPQMVVTDAPQESFYKYHKKGE